MGWDWSVIGTAVGGFSTLIYTAFTYALLRENRALRKAGSEPKVVAHFEPHSAGNGALLLVFSNVGTGPALDVSYSFEYGVGDFENYKILFEYARERAAVTMIGQGEKFSFIFAIGFQLFRPKDPDVSGRLQPFRVKVNWRSVAANQVFSEKYLLDIAAYDGLPGFFQKPPIVKIAEELEGIKMSLAKLADSQDCPLQTLDITGIEQDIRNIRPAGPPDAGHESE
ncbi:hypothetical protein [Pseudomonas syringae]|uniref:hypothetical protein n=1 Tax=Pseudomonas syringae TaxID=317 RepID=UPI0004674566|nr:hypothetical protein [Pseudomonas syringae]